MSATAKSESLIDAYFNAARRNGTMRAWHVCLTATFDTCFAKRLAKTLRLSTPSKHKPT